MWKLLGHASVLMFFCSRWLCNPPAKNNLPLNNSPYKTLQINDISLKTMVVYCKLKKWGEMIWVWLNLHCCCKTLMLMLLYRSGTSSRNSPALLWFIFFCITSLSVPFWFIMCTVFPWGTVLSSPCTRSLDRLCLISPQSLF